jgi:hypothetical protein
MIFAETELAGEFIVDLARPQDARVWNCGRAL